MKIVYIEVYFTNLVMKELDRFFCWAMVLVTKALIC